MRRVQHVVLKRFSALIPDQNTLYNSLYHFIYNFFGSSFIVFSFFIKIIFNDDIDKLNASMSSGKLSDDFARVQTEVQDVEMDENGDDDFKAE